MAGVMAVPLPPIPVSTTAATPTDSTRPLRTLVSIVEPLDQPSNYRDGSYKKKDVSQETAKKVSSTLYVGNLSFFSTEEQIHALFSLCGDIKRIIMGLDRNTKTPCGFAFVEYISRQSALDALKYISGTKLDERIIRADLDAGFVDGRQYGRGKSGGQVRDEYRLEDDPGRGGLGHNARMKMEAAQRAREARMTQEDVYQEDHVAGIRDVPTGGGSDKRMPPDSSPATTTAAKRARQDDEDELGDQGEARFNPRFREEHAQED